MSVRRDLRLGVGLAVVAAVAAGGLGLQRLPGRGVEATAVEAAVPEPERVHQQFQQAALLLHARRYGEARAALEALVRLAPELPEAQVNLGFALLGLRDFENARRRFERAIELRPRQLNAYYGLAEALEGLADLEAALGAMRTYAHLTTPTDPFRVRAEAAIWEWSAALEGRREGLPPEGGPEMGAENP